MRWSQLGLVVALSSFASLSASSPAAAQDGDRVTFGDDVIVRSGERVHDVATFGGDAVIDGDVDNDVVTFGGDATIRGHVNGNVATFGGDVTLAPGATVHGEVSTLGGAMRTGPAGTPTDIIDAPESPIDGLAGFVRGMLESAASFALLFFLGLGMMGLLPERLRALEVVIAREPLRVGSRGFFGFILAVLAIILLAITLIGIPAAIALGMALSIASYVGLAAVAAVIGVILPVERLRDRPVLQLGAGVLTLFVASLVPGVGGLIVAIASAVGLGAVIHTRLGKDVPPRLDASDGGGSPYRTAEVL